MACCPVLFEWKQLAPSKDAPAGDSEPTDFVWSIAAEGSSMLPQRAQVVRRPPQRIPCPPAGILRSYPPYTAERWAATMTPTRPWTATVRTAPYPFRNLDHRNNTMHAACLKSIVYIIDIQGILDLIIAASKNMPKKKSSKEKSKKKAARPTGTASTSTTARAGGISGNAVPAGASAAAGAHAQDGTTGREQLRIVRRRGALFRACAQGSYIYSGKVQVTRHGRSSGR